jgi:hypothetical protein
MRRWSNGWPAGRDGRGAAFLRWQFYRFAAGGSRKLSIVYLVYRVVVCGFFYVKGDGEQPCLLGWLSLPRRFFSSFYVHGGRNDVIFLDSVPVARLFP